MTASAYKIVVCGFKNMRHNLLSIEKLSLRKFRQSEISIVNLSENILLENPVKSIQLKIFSAV